MKLPRLRRGPLLGIASTVAFTLMVALVKICREDLSAWEVIHFRSLFAIPIAGLAAWRVGFRIVDRRTFGLRLVLGFAAMTCFFTAAKGLPLANLALISRMQPILLALIAPLLLGADERSGRLVWGVMAAGILGCGVLLWPELQLQGGGLTEGGLYALWALGAALFSAGAHLALRRLGASDQPASVVFWFQVCVFFLAGAGVLMTEGWSLPPTRLWLPLAGIGLFATGGQLLMTWAYRLDRASVVAASSYTAPLFGAVMDLLVFATAPTWELAIGGTLVIGAGLTLLMTRESPPAEAG